MPDTCATCRFWDVYAEGDEHTSKVGDCRAHPPRIVEAAATRSVTVLASDWIEPDYLYNASAFPVTHRTSWCGEHQPRRPEAPLC